MARRSADSFNVVPIADVRLTRLSPRPDAPAAIKQIFVELVASVRPEHFRRGDADLLEQFAQSIALARKAYAELERGGPVVNGRASPWLVVLEKAHRSSTALAARLRLAPQMRLDRKAVGKSPGPAPSYYDLMHSQEHDNET
jgi:hypothetical protein